jgi:hypothetical protein
LPASEYAQPTTALQFSYNQSENVCGNTVATAGYAIQFSVSNATALVLNNNFSNASYVGIGDATGSSLTNAQIYGNILGEGVTFHVQVDYLDGFGWFLDQNTYLNSSTMRVPPFTDPVASAAHISN